MVVLLCVVLHHCCVIVVAVVALLRKGCGRIQDGVFYNLVKVISRLWKGFYRAVEVVSYGFCTRARVATMACACFHYVSPPFPPKTQSDTNFVKYKVKRTSSPLPSPHALFPRFPKVLSSLVVVSHPAQLPLRTASGLSKACPRSHT